jgi:Protein of unknown function (DUF1566)
MGRGAANICGLNFLRTVLEHKSSATISERAQLLFYLSIRRDNGKEIVVAISDHSKKTCRRQPTKLVDSNISGSCFGKQSLSLFISINLILVLVSSAVAGTFKLPDTGQTTCYDDSGNVVDCAGTGQDGEYNINPMSYTDNGDGTVTDNNIGLMWQKQDDGNMYYWYQASGTYDSTFNPASQNVCGALRLGGHTDWRLPAKKELMNIVDYAIPYPGPTINITYFPNTQSSVYRYWSSTTPAYGTEYAWDVNFGGGYDDSSTYKGYGFGRYVRCVRGGQSGSFDNFQDNLDGTVTDTTTGLIWQQGEPGVMTWDQALSFCEGLSLGGNSDWRLPNIKDLVSLTDDTTYNPAIDTDYFPNAYASSYWSSTTCARIPYYAWGVGFFDGSVNTSDGKGGISYVRCVRGGQYGALPEGRESFVYSAIESPQLSDTPVNAKPIGVGAAASGGNTLSVKIGLDQFSSPVDVYLLLYFPALSPDIYSWTGSSFQPYSSSDLVPWQQAFSGHIKESFFGDLSIAGLKLPQGMYYLGLLVTPPGISDLSTYYLWVTDFAVSQAAP